MSELTPAQWREIEKSAVLAEVGIGRTIRAIELRKLREIILKSRRTNEQNALLWALYGDALEQAGEALGGWTKDDIHEFMLGEWSGWERCVAFGRTRLKPKRRSSRLTKTEFSDFVEFVVRKFAEHGIVLELPGDVIA